MLRIMYSYIHNNRVTEAVHYMNDCYWISINAAWLATSAKQNCESQFFHRDYLEQQYPATNF